MTCIAVKVRNGSEHICADLLLNSGESSPSLTGALNGCMHALNDAYTGVLISP